MRKIGIFGGDMQFERFLRSCYPGELCRFSDPEELISAAEGDCFEAVLLLPGGETPIPTVSFRGMRALAALKKRGQKLYAEEYDAGDYNSRGLFGYMTDTAPRALHDEVLCWGDRLLQLRTAEYIPGRAEEGEELAVFTNAIGVHRPVIPGTLSFPGLVRSGTFLSASFPLSRYDRYTMLPRQDWRALYITIFAPLLSAAEDAVGRAFDALWPPIALSGETDPENAVRNALRWHLESGMLEDGSGKSGSYEMLRSADLTVRKNQRTDSMLLTAALFCTAGKRWGDSALMEKGKNLAEYCLNEGLQYREGPNRGLFHWFHDLGAGPLYLFSSDTGRDAMAMLQLYLATGEEKYLRCAKDTADAFFRWTGETALFREAFFSTEKYDLSTLPQDGEPHNAPSFYDAPAILMASLWSLTGEERYRDWLCRMVTAVNGAYPDYNMNFTPKTYNLLYSRLLTILSAAQAAGCGDFSERINTLLRFFAPLQDSSGGFMDSAVIDTESTYTHPEFSVGMGSKYDRVVDNLYCTNNLMEAFSVLGTLDEASGVDMALLGRMKTGLIHFVTATQLTEPKKELFGGWMRAFDMETWEYYGINKDKDWGPYCIMCGWVMGFVPLGLLDACGTETIFDLPARRG